jgi:hypothetical protein
MGKYGEAWDSLHRSGHLPSPASMATSPGPSTPHAHRPLSFCVICVICGRVRPTCSRWPVPAEHGSWRPPPVRSLPAASPHLLAPRGCSPPFRLRVLRVLRSSIPQSKIENPKSKMHQDPPSRAYFQQTAAIRPPAFAPPRIVRHVSSMDRRLQPADSAFGQPRAAGAPGANPRRSRSALGTGPRARFEYGSALRLCVSVVIWGWWRRSKLPTLAIRPHTNSPIFITLTRYPLPPRLPHHAPRAGGRRRVATEQRKPRRLSDHVTM